MKFDNCVVALYSLWKAKLKNLQNYDESRVHALRGVHDLAITLEDTVIFQGEITCAFTADNDLRPMGDVGFWPVWHKLCCVQLWWNLNPYVSRKWEEKSNKTSFLQTILFTTDEAILERIAENDVCLVDDDVVASSMDLLTSDTQSKG